MRMTAQPRSAPDRARRRGRARAWRRLIIRLFVILTCLIAVAGASGSFYAYRQVSAAGRAA
jgi:hypothetical protein